MKFKTVWLLVKVFYRAWAPFSRLFRSLGTGKTRKPVGKILVMAGKVLLAGCMLLGVLAILALLGVLYYGFQILGIEYAGRPDMGIFMGLCVGAVFLFISSVLVADSILYKARDLPMLLPLPITGKELFFSRFFILYLMVAGIQALVLGPAVIVAALTGLLSVYIFTGFLIALVAGPVIPVLLGALIAWLVQRSGRKWVSYVVKGLSSVGLTVTNLLVVGFSSANVVEDMFTSMQRQIDLILSLPSRLWMVGVMSASFFPKGGMMAGWLASPLTLLLNVAVFAVGVMVLGKTYMRAIRTLPSVTNRSHQVSVRHKPDARRYAHRSQTLMLRALVRRELAGIFSSSQVAFEIVAQLFLPIILIVIYTFMGRMNDISAMIVSIASFTWFPYIVVALFVLMSLMTVVSGTSVSREGKYFHLSLSWPVSSHEMIRAKLIVHMLLVQGSAFIYLIVVGLLFHFPLGIFFWMILLSFFINLTGGAIGLAVDYHNPHIDWLVPSQAVKQNMNGLIAMGINLGILIVMAACSVIPALWWGIRVEISAWFSVIFAIFSSVGGIRLAGKVATKALLPR
ncbi:hypothetical protein [Parasphaerochaeta coccoides]|uniref:ABC-2 type transporter n=1 Tax=Parasphaerochaeta coccoides (strain ATCC BAA-1237 / DSM 17374 / SPN1) TaxID=760011 RepID=F4GLG5_PARC1|nr:hypothetical protein [Parasphaerochaeta coccoides]AEC01935.1 hypothetical protein Spico_0709 [Parasphaerochaeta coccoides DSM 17374]